MNGNESMSFGEWALGSAATILTGALAVLRVELFKEGVIKGWKWWNNRRHGKGRRKIDQLKLAEIRAQKFTENHLWRELDKLQKQIDRISKESQENKAAVTECRTEKISLISKVESLLKWKAKAEIQLEICKKRRKAA